MKYHIPKEHTPTEGGTHTPPLHFALGHCARIALGIALLATLLAACTNPDRQAQAYLDAAREALSQDRYAQAKAFIDSIKILYPKAFDTRRQGIALMREVETAETRRTLAYLDSLQTATQAKVDAISHRFTFEKDTAYQTIGHYLHPSQTVENNLHRTYLRFQTDENGRLSMTSTYCGATNIHHTTVRVTAPDGTFAQTPTAPDQYETTVLDEHIEKADFNRGQDGDVMAFIYLNHDKNLRLTLGGERTFNTTLTPQDREALVAVYDLANLLTTLAQTRTQIGEAQQKLAFYQHRARQATEQTTGQTAEQQEQGNQNQDN